MSTTRHRTRIRAIRASRHTGIAHSIIGPRFTTRGPRSSMKALQNPTIRPCPSNIITRPRTDTFRSSWIRPRWADL